MTHFVSSQAHPFGQKACAEERKASSISEEKANPFLVASLLFTLPLEQALPEAISMAKLTQFLCQAIIFILVKVSQSERF